MPDVIDLDRGVTQRKHTTGFLVSMYKDDPGVYFNPKGEAVSEEIAKAAGFPTDQHSLERRKKAALAEKRAEIEEQFSGAEAEVEEQLQADAETTDYVAWEGEGVNRVTKRNDKGEPRETERLEMIHHGGRLFNVIDKATKEVIVIKVSKEEAMDALMKGVT